MFFQNQPDIEIYFRKKATGSNWIKTHLHGFFELQCCLEGQISLQIGGRACTLQAGEAALIFPYQPHSYCNDGSKGWFFTFDPELIGTFARQHAEVIPVDNKFQFTYDFSLISEDSDLYRIKGFLYTMCSAAAKMQFVPASASDDSLLEKMLLLTEEKFSDSNYDLKKLASVLEYDYGYLSKYFLRQTGTGFHNYLNQRRISKAVSLLERGAVDYISDVAFACGYGSVRSFNRNFKAVEGVSPSEYGKNSL